MAKQVEDRYASMNELATALADFLHSATVPSSSSTTSPTPRPASEAARPVGSDVLVAQFFELLYANKTPPHPIPTPQSSSSVILARDGHRPRWTKLVLVVLLGALVLGVIVALSARKGRIGIVVDDPKAVVKKENGLKPEPLHPGISGKRPTGLRAHPRSSGK
jgi:hypothetical protein